MVFEREKNRTKQLGFAKGVIDSYKPAGENPVLVLKYTANRLTCSKMLLKTKGIVIVEMERLSMQKSENIHDKNQ